MQPMNAPLNIYYAVAGEAYTYVYHSTFQPSKYIISISTETGILNYSTLLCFQYQDKIVVLADGQFDCC